MKTQSNLCHNVLNERLNLDDLKYFTTRRDTNYLIHANNRLDVQFTFHIRTIKQSHLNDSKKPKK